MKLDPINEKKGLIDWTPCCLLEPKADGSFTIRWNDQCLRDYNINKDTATTEFMKKSNEAAAGRRAYSELIAGAQWSL